MVQWSDSFWGEGNRGFDLLSNNVKSGAIAIEEFQRFLAENSQCESVHYKALTRVQVQLSKIHHVGTFTPIWSLLRDLYEKISSAHSGTFQFYQTLLDDIHNYQEIFQKKFKKHIQKDSDICRTADLIVQLNQSLNNVTKAKEQYHLLAFDYERTKRISGGNVTSHSPGTSDNNLTNPMSSKQTERLEKKYRQAQDEYRLALDKYNSVRNDYEKKFHDACTKFQDFEIEHIEKMLAFSLSYAQILQRTYDQIQQAQTDFSTKLKTLTGNDLLEIFVEQKKTGVGRPPVLQFEEFDQSASQPNQLLDLPVSQDEATSSDQIESNPNGASRAHHYHHHHHSNFFHALSPISSVSHRHSANDSPLTSSTQSMNNELSSNPFNVRIKKKPKMPVIFGANRRKSKKDSGSSTPVKTQKVSQQQIDGPTLMNSQFFTGEITSLSPNANKSKSSTPEPLSQSNDFNSDHQGAASKSTSSSGSSDDDDDEIPMQRVHVTIKPIESMMNETNVSEEDQDTKILRAMREIAANIGETSTNSRRLTPKSPEPSITTRLPPPVPNRSNNSVSINVISETIDHSDVFSSNDQFHRSSIVPVEGFLSNDIAANQAWISLPVEQSKTSSSFSSSEDDKEVTGLSRSDLIRKKLSPVNSILFQRPVSASPTLTNRPEQNASPLSFEGFDRIPLAIAFQETINVHMIGDQRQNWKYQIIGEMLISFPASILAAFAEANRPKNSLEFRLKNLDEIENVNLKSSSVTQKDSTYAFDMSQLIEILQDLFEKSPSSPFFNLSVLNYEVKSTDVSSVPIQLSAQWTRTFESISVTIQYRFHSSSLVDSIRLNNNVIIIYTIINEGQKLQESSPLAGWSNNEHKLWWKVAYTKNGTGNLTATILTEQSDPDLPLTTYSTVNVHFLGENGLFSSIDFELISPDYRISLMKKKILSGKYQFEPDRSEPVHLFRRPTLTLP